MPRADGLTSLSGDGRSARRDSMMRVARESAALLDLRSVMTQTIFSTTNLAYRSHADSLALVVFRTLRNSLTRSAALLDLH
jgi:hypothetical protein